MHTKLEYHKVSGEGQTFPFPSPDCIPVGRGTPHPQARLPQKFSDMDAKPTPAQRLHLRGVGTPLLHTTPS